MDMVCAGCPFIAGEFCTVDQWPECHGLERKKERKEDEDEEED